MISMIGNDLKDGVWVFGIFDLGGPHPFVFPSERDHRKTMKVARTLPSPARRERVRVRVTGADKGAGHGITPTTHSPTSSSSDAQQGFATVSPRGTFAQL